MRDLSIYPSGPKSRHNGARFTNMKHTPTGIRRIAAGWVFRAQFKRTSNAEGLT